MSKTAADPSIPRVTRWRNQHAGLSERDRRRRATPEPHRECRTMNVDLSVTITDYIENFYNTRRRQFSELSHAERNR